MSRRDNLYKDFIVAASKAYGDALLSNEPQIQELLAIYAMISRMRLMSLPGTVACAEKIMGKRFGPARWWRQGDRRHRDPA
jgi:hypothetical protein